MFWSKRKKAQNTIAAAEASKSGVQVADEAAYHAGPGTILESIVIDPNCQTMAYAQGAFSGMGVVVNGEPGPVYDEILKATPIVSAAGRVTYGARKGAKWFAVTDGEAGHGYQGLGASSFSFGPLGRRFAYTASNGGKWDLLIDGGPVLTVDHTITGTFSFSPDESRWAIAARDQGRATCVIDGVTVGEYDSPTSVPAVFSLTSKRIGFYAERRGEWITNIDGADSPAYENASGLVFSPDDTSYAFVARRRGRRFLVINGEETGDFDEVARSSPQFAVSGALVYGAKCGDQWIVYRNGQIVTRSKLLGTGTPRFVPGTEKVAVIEVRPSGMSITIDGTASSSTHTGIMHLVFSADGKRMAYAAAESEFSWVQVVDGVSSANYEKVDAVTFSPDGLHYAYRAWKARQARIVVDGVECAKGESPVPGSPLAWESGRLRTFVRRGNQLIRLAIGTLATET
jgi:hypothetical protein